MNTSAPTSTDDTKVTRMAPLRLLLAVLIFARLTLSFRLELFACQGRGWRYVWEDAKLVASWRVLNDVLFHGQRHLWLHVSEALCIPHAQVILEEETVDLDVELDGIQVVS